MEFCGSLVFLVFHGLWESLLLSGYLHARLDVICFLRIIAEGAYLLCLLFGFVHPWLIPVLDR